MTNTAIARHYAICLIAGIATGIAVHRHIPNQILSIGLGIAAFIAASAAMTYEREHRENP